MAKDDRRADRTDRRVQYTKRALREALVHLMRENHIS